MRGSSIPGYLTNPKTIRPAFIRNGGFAMDLGFVCRLFIDRDGFMFINGATQRRGPGVAARKKVIPKISSGSMEGVR